jgi:hypothetical protein
LFEGAGKSEKGKTMPRPTSRFILVLCFQAQESWEEKVPFIDFEADIKLAIFIAFVWFMGLKSFLSDAIVSKSFSRKRNRG